MKFFKPLLYLSLLMFVQPAVSQINKTGFDRYQILDQDYLVGYRSDSFFVCSNSGYLRFSGKGTPIQALNYDLLIFARGNSKGIIQSRIFEGDTLLFPPVYKSIDIESPELIALIKPNGNTEWLDINTRELHKQKPESFTETYSSNGDFMQDGTSGSNAETEFLSNNDTFRASNGDLYYRGPFRGSQYAIHQRGKYIGISNANHGRFQEIMPCIYTKTQSLFDFNPNKHIIFFQSDSGYITAWTAYYADYKPLISDSIELYNYSTEVRQKFYFTQKNNVVYIKENGKTLPLINIYVNSSTWNYTTWFFETPRRTFYNITNNGLPHPTLIKPVLSVENTMIFSGLKNNTAIEDEKVYYLYKQGIFSDAIIDYQLKKDSGGNSYLFYRYVQSRDTLRIDLRWYTRSIENGVYEVLDGDEIFRKNSDNTWDVLSLDKTGYTVKATALPDLPTACFLKVGKFQLCMGYWVKIAANNYSLYNGFHKCIYTQISDPGFSKMTGVFSGTNSKGKFICLGGLDEGENIYYLHPGELQFNHPHYVRLNYNGKLGYFSYWNRLNIQPKFDEFTFNKNILIARAGQKYYFYDTGIFK